MISRDLSFVLNNFNEEERKNIINILNDKDTRYFGYNFLAITFFATYISSIEHLAFKFDLGNYLTIIYTFPFEELREKIKIEGLNYSSEYPAKYFLYTYSREVREKFAKYIFLPYGDEAFHFGKVLKEIYYGNIRIDLYSDYQEYERYNPLQKMNNKKGIESIMKSYEAGSSLYKYLYYMDQFLADMYVELIISASVTHDTNIIYLFGKISNLVLNLIKENKLKKNRLIKILSEIEVHLENKDIAGLNGLYENLIDTLQKRYSYENSYEN